MSRYQWVMLGLAFSTALTMHLLLFSYSTLVSSIIVDMRSSHAQAGFIFSACIMTLVLLRIPWGLYCDRIGFRLVVGLATLLMGLFGFLRGFAIDYATLLSPQVLLGVGMAAVIPSLPKLVGASFARKSTIQGEWSHRLISFVKFLFHAFAKSIGSPLMNTSTSCQFRC